MTKNPQAKRAFLAFCLFLLSSTIAHAFPNYLDMAFVKASKAESSAACVIIWQPAVSKSKNVYCRYELDKPAHFLRDDDRGFHFRKILSLSQTPATFEKNVRNFLKKKSPNYHSQITSSDVKNIVAFMSNANLKYFTLGGKTYRTYSLNDMSDDLVSQNVGNKHEQFAYLVHSAIKKIDLTKPPETDKTHETQAGKKSSQAGKQPSETVNQQLETKIQPLETDNQELETKIQPLETDIQPFENSNKIFYRIRFGLSFIIFGFLLWLLVLVFLLKRSLNSQLETLLKTEDFHTNFNTIKKEQEQFSEILTNPETYTCIIPSNKTELDSLKEKHKNLVKTSTEETKIHNKDLQDAKSKLKTAKSERDTAKSELETAKSELKQIEEYNELIDLIMIDTEDQLKQEQTQRQHAEKALNDSEQTTQEFLSQRFRISKPVELPFSEWITKLREQQGVWRWLQPALLGELSACEQIVKVIKSNDKDNKILKLLYIDDLMQHWVPLVEKSYESNDQLWEVLKDVDGHFWLHRLLRASDLLQSYFPEELKSLPQHFFNINGILRAAFVEMGINFLSPKILDVVPNYIQPNPNQHEPNPELVELVKPLVLAKSEQLKDARFVVDIKSYGFGEKAENQVQVVVYSRSEWPD